MARRPGEERGKWGRERGVSKHVDMEHHCLPNHIKVAPIGEKTWIDFPSTIGSSTSRTGQGRTEAK